MDLEISFVLVLFVLLARVKDLDCIERELKRFGPEMGHCLGKAKEVRESLEKFSVMR